MVKGVFHNTVDTKLGLCTTGRSNLQMLPHENNSNYFRSGTKPGGGVRELVYVHLGGISSLAQGDLMERFHNTQPPASYTPDNPLAQAHRQRSRVD